MKPGRPSQTAAWVAALRGIGGVSRPPIVEDPLAEDLVPRRYAWAIRLVHRWPRTWQWMHAAVNVAALGNLDHIAYRTRAIDDAIEGAVRRGTRQVVLLGAGLDARAWRLPCLRESTVFEVDYPATQAYKRERIGGRPPLARHMEFVSIDFQHDVLSERLEASGHDSAAPSVFVWEGVTMYLSVEEVDRTLSQIERRAAAGSLLLVTYLRKDTNGVATELLRWLVRSAREPFRAKYTREAMGQALEAHGFKLASDEGDRDWLARAGDRRAPADIERLSIAEKVAC